MTIEIPALPAALREIPGEREAWLVWRDRALAYRCLVREACEEDHGLRADAIACAAGDPVFDFLVFGAVFEPRDRINADGTLRAKGWYPWIPYGFQARMVRWIEACLAVVPGSPAALLGRGDGILEKPRGMTWSWTIAGFAANRWKYDDGFIAGLMSYREDEVDMTGSTNSLFYKVEGFLGLDKKVPTHRRLRVGDEERDVPVRSPDWLVPAGYDPRVHNLSLAISHPERTNAILGYSTTSRTSTGSRLSAMFLDEAAKFAAFRSVYDGLTAVTDHRLAGSSADRRFGTGFMDEARHAEKAAKEGTRGPSFLRLQPTDHPEQSEVWREEIEARHSGTPEAKAALAREYDMDYEAGQTGYIYREKGIKIVPKALAFAPAREYLDFCIDPGIRDLTAFHLVKYSPEHHRYGLLASYANAGKPAEFYASLYAASPLEDKYDYGEEEERIMEWFARFGRAIRYRIGDPAGKQRGGGQATSFYDDFHKAVLALSDGGRGAPIWSSDKRDFKGLPARHAALRWLLDLLDINDAPDTEMTVKAINDHKWKELPEGREIVTLPKEPVHGPGSDLVTALEFYACHRKFGGEAAAEQTAKPKQRYSMSGRPLPPRRQPFDRRKGYAT